MEFFLHGLQGDFLLHESPFFQMVDTNFHAKSWVSSSNNCLVIASYMVHGIFLAWIPCKFFFAWMLILSGQSIWTSMQNLESVAQKITESWLLLYLRTFFGTFLLFLVVWSIHTNFHAKSGVWRGGGAHFLKLIIQSKLFCSKFASSDLLNIANVPETKTGLQWKPLKSTVSFILISNQV